MSINADPYGLPEGGTTTPLSYHRGIRRVFSCVQVLPDTANMPYARTGQLVLSVAQSGSDNGLKCFETLVEASHFL